LYGGQACPNPTPDLFQLKTDSQDAVFKAACGDSEVADLSGGVDMITNTGDCVIVSHGNDSDFVSHGFWQSFEVKLVSCGLPADQLDDYWKVFRDDPVDLIFDLFDFHILKRPLEMIITFGFFLVDMGAEAAFALEFHHHSAVQEMFCRMHAS
jgi:hypothetical protein